MAEGQDGELIARVADGDAAAFRALVRRHGDAVYRFLVRRCPSEQAAEDALQETFSAVWRSASSYRGEGSGRGWLFGLARRHAARTWRRRAGEPIAHEPLDALGHAAGWGTADPERVVAAAEDRAAVWAALDRLSDADREILILRDLEGISGEETAEILGLTLPAMKSRLHRARLRLMALLRETHPDAGPAEPGGLR